MTPVRLDGLHPRCFQGVVPSVLATSSATGIPNITYVSQIFLLDANRVALSCQFFNKTTANLRENPFACANFLDPVTFEAYRLRLKYAHSETSGPLFDAMATRIQAIATHTGMAGIFKLISAEVFEVLSAHKVDDFLLPPGPEDAPPEPPSGPLSELRNLQMLTERVNRATSLESLLQVTLQAMRELFGFEHAMVLVPDETHERLMTIATSGYGASTPGASEAAVELGVGAEVPFGAGLIGTAAKERRILSMAVGAELSYGRAIREQVLATGHSSALAPEIPLPGLPDVKSQLVLPLLFQDRLLGVLAVESESPAAFDDWHEAFLAIIANQIASGLDRWSRDESEEAPKAPPARATPPAVGPKRSFCFYKNDDCVFVDGEYLIRNVPGKILWKLLVSHRREGRSEFTNRELRLDPGLGLPPLKDNLESRLILLRKRLAQKCPDVRLVSRGRGRFALELEREIELTERESA